MHITLHAEAFMRNIVVAHSFIPMRPSLGADVVLPSVVVSSAVVSMLILLIFGSLVLPAVWSRHTHRRRAARAVLKLVLTWLRPPARGEKK